MGRIEIRQHIPISQVPKETIRLRNGEIVPNPTYLRFLENVERRNDCFYINTEAKGQKVFTGLGALK